jgi:hypothetical protein
VKKADVAWQLSLAGAERDQPVNVWKLFAWSGTHQPACPSAASSASSSATSAGAPLQVFAAPAPAHSHTCLAPLRHRTADAEA